MKHIKELIEKSIETSCIMDKPLPFSKMLTIKLPNKIAKVLRNATMLLLLANRAVYVSLLF
jgi:hypothetical protein